jgi:hypothetical protein
MIALITNKSVSIKSETN